MPWQRLVSNIVRSMRSLSMRMKPKSSNSKIMKAINITSSVTRVISMQWFGARFGKHYLLFLSLDWSSKRPIRTSMAKKSLKIRWLQRSFTIQERSMTGGRSCMHKSLCGVPCSFSVLFLSQSSLSRSLIFTSRMWSPTYKSQSTSTVSIKCMTWLYSRTLGGASSN